MHPLGWGWAGFVWGYAIAWALVNDRVKLLAYRILDPRKPALLGKKPVDRKAPDLKPEIATRAYELFEKRGRADGQATQDWTEAEREIRKEHVGTKP
jgi:H+-transporting ATPase